mgnify:FL=1
MQNLENIEAAGLTCDKERLKFMKKTDSEKKNLISKKTKKGILCVAVVAMIAGAIAFFSYYRVDTVEVRGSSHYTDEEIKSMVLRGPLASNSFLAPLLYSNSNTDNITFVDGFAITRLNRNSICISVKEKKPVGCIHYLDSYVYFDRNGIFIEGTTTRDESIPYFDGIQVNDVIMNEKLDIRGESVLNTAVALSTIFQKSSIVPDHIQFDETYAITLIYGDITVKLGKDESLEEKMNRVLAILPDISGKKGILHMESVSTDSNTFEEEEDENTLKLQAAIENWTGGYDEDGDYTGEGEYDINGNYVGAKPTLESVMADSQNSDPSSDTGEENADNSQNPGENTDSASDISDGSDNSEDSLDSESDENSDYSYEDNGDYNDNGDYGDEE